MNHPEGRPRELSMTNTIIRSSGPRPVSLSDFLLTPLRHRVLIYRLIQRDVVGRYRGSFIGLAWSFLTPVIMLVMYTFVFSVVFKAKWQGYDTSSGYALILFSGLIVHGMLAECLSRSPMVIVGNPNYVKKMVFPLEIYAWVIVGSAAFHLAVSWLVLMLAQAIFGAGVPYTTLLFPVVVLPLALGCLGVVWFLAAMGTFYRDIAQVTGVVSTVLLFLAPIFYSTESLPPKYRALIQLNPLTAVLEQVRSVLMFGAPPDWPAYAVALAAGLAIAFAGYAWFQKLRDGFADVI